MAELRHHVELSVVSAYHKRITEPNPLECYVPRVSTGAKSKDSNMSADAKLTEFLAKHSLQMPPAPKAMGVYKPIVIVGNLAYASGHGPLQADGKLMVGRVGSEVDQEAGYLAARQTGLALLASLQAVLGSLDKVKRVIKTLGMVNSTAEFKEHPKVINGCSELFAEIWGADHGVGARSAVGMGSLPGNISVEIEVIFELA